MLGFFQRLAASREDAAATGSGEYAGIEAGQVPAYQRYFIEIVNSVSVDNLAKKAQGLRYDPKQEHRDRQLLRHICERALAESRVQAEHLMRLFESFVAADPATRARNKAKWVGRVISGKIGAAAAEADASPAGAVPAESPQAEPARPGPSLTGGS